MPMLRSGARRGRAAAARKADQQAQESDRGCSGEDHLRPNLADRGNLGLARAAEVLPYVESDLKRTAARVVERAKEICTRKLVIDVVVEVVEGDARNVLCEVVEKHHASILVVGSHGYGAIKRAVLGSV
ncbi:hypothetical protein ACOSQ3_031542 [Xanthoceras sorbifolium]